MTLYLGVWTFSVSGASQIFISLLIFLLNGIWLLCVAGVLFASFGNKVKQLIGTIRKRIFFSAAGGNVKQMRVGVGKSDASLNRIILPIKANAVDVEMHSVSRTTEDEREPRSRIKKDEIDVINPL